MSRSFLPIALVLIGLSMLFYAAIHPLFEWQISEIVTDFPSSYEVDVLHSPWSAYLGDSLIDHSYVFENISVSENGKGCPESDLHFAVNRSQNDKLLEQLLLTRLFDYRWVMGWILIEFGLSVAYSFWYTIWHEDRSVLHTTILAIFAILCFYLIFSQVMRGWGPSIGNFLVDNPAKCQGTITFSARLAKTYYSVAVLWFLGAFVELVALAVMVRQIILAVSKGKESHELGVG
jgi:hypothetical protein